MKIAGPVISAAVFAAALGLALHRPALAPTPAPKRTTPVVSLLLPTGPELPPEAPAPDPVLASETRVQVDRTPTGSIPPAPPVAPRVELTAVAPVPSSADLARFSAAAALYRKGSPAVADATAASFADPLQRAALEWIAVKAAPSPERLRAFEAAHRDWPASDWLRDAREGLLLGTHAPAAAVDAEFANAAPRTNAGVLAFARAAMSEGRKDEAAKAIRSLWRERDLDGWTEAAVLKEFAALLSRDDHKYRADRLLYAERAAPAMRAAALAGLDVVALASARWEAARGPLSARSIAAIPASAQGDAGLLFARVQDARRANRTEAAAAWLALAPKDPAKLIDPDKWWTERRMVAREYLDRGAPEKAYAICAEATTASGPARVDAAFHAGWIALRFLDNAAKAEGHFTEAAKAAETPLAHARANYWWGRAAEALGKSEEARLHYERAAAFPIAYYGQLAAKRLGRETALALRVPSLIARGEDRAEATRIIELYYEAGLDDVASSLAFAAVSVWTDEAQIAALGEVIARKTGAPMNVAFGKRATERGFPLDETAFPMTGLPAFAPLPHSADAANVLAVARQESEFIYHAASGAGAKGLMQILPGTAQDTARRAGVAFDYGRLISDPAFNLQLGAAYLGQLTDDHGGSLEMTFAAYNAGAGRVAQWIAAYGDPRTGAVDPVDWVERIPFDETRDYVQRVSENLGVYRARLAGVPAVASPTPTPKLARN